jgi:rhamnose transport system permease protein
LTAITPPKRSAFDPVGMLAAIAAHPEVITLALLVIAFAAGAMLSPYFLDVGFLLDSTSLYMEIGVMALAMTLVIVSGSIDLSVASNLALTAVIVAKLHAEHGVPMAVAAALAPLIGGALGLFNGLIITRLGLPSLTVTLATLALYRGVAQVLIGDRSIGRFPEWFVGIDSRYAGPFPLPLILFLSLAAVIGIVLRMTTFGRCVFAIGTNEAAARFSGIPTRRVKATVFCLSGAMAGVGSVMMLSRLGVARYDLALGDELAVITAVVLGGTDIFGGRGGVLGTVIALFLLGIIRRGMGVANVTADTQLTVTGTLLVAAVLLARGSAKVKLWPPARRRRLESSGGL